jgi:hypothetical protein
MAAKPFRHPDINLKRAISGGTLPFSWPQKKNVEVLEQFEAWLAKETSDWTTPLSVRTYKQDQSWLIELEAKHLLANGYEVQDQSSAGSHVNVGRTATAAVLTGGLSLLFGGSRSKGTVTLMYLKKTKAMRK